MVNKLVNSRLSDAFSTDPAVALWTYVKARWGDAHGYSPPAVAKVKFDTKFGETKGFYNYFIVENMPNIVRPQVLGGSRYVYDDVKRVQILCVGPSAKNNKWNMERHVDGIINGNVTGMQATYGIDTIQLSDFTELNLPPDQNITNMQPDKRFQTARSTATVTLKWEQEIVAL